jgi:hypothetical protein
MGVVEQEVRTSGVVELSTAVGWPFLVIFPDLGLLSLGLATTGRLVATVCA